MTCHVVICLSLSSFGNRCFAPLLCRDLLRATGAPTRPLNAVRSRHEGTHSESLNNMHSSSRKSSIIYMILCIQLRPTNTSNKVYFDKIQELFLKAYHAHDFIKFKFETKFKFHKNLFRVSK